ncbi:MAG: site-specific integrase [Oscillospiraceae bacterium]|nr:site-specific integrase [Oscillospiraceae bacterium]
MSRKGENIYKRKDGRWEGRYIYSYDKNGHAKYRSVYAHSYTEVKTKLSQIDKKEFVTSCLPHNPILQNICGEWLSTVKFKNKQSTYCKYSNVCNNHILPALGYYPINKITTYQIEVFISELTQKDLSAKSIKDIFGVVKRIFQYAESCSYQIICNLSVISVNNEYKEMRVFSLQEQKCFVNYLLKDMDLCKLGIYICLFTGIRIGELCALTLNDIDFENKTISINKTMQRIQTPDTETKTSIIITKPKSRSSARIIPLPEFLIEMLCEHCNKNEKAAFLLSGSSEKYVEPRYMQYFFAKCVSECGIEKANFHCLRHTFATRCVEAGFEIKSLSEILGHSSVNITLNRYVHSSMDLKRENMKKIVQY